MKIDKFEVEMWMTEHEKDCKYNLAETCVSSLSLNQLLEYVDDKQEVMDHLLQTKLDYGPIEGSIDLKQEILTLYQTGNESNLAISHGCVNANELVLITLLNKGDHLICIEPTYQQFYSFPETFGVETSLVSLKEENNWQVDIEEFKQKIQSNTKMICLVNPNNPTGTLFSKEFLDQIIQLARKYDLYLLCDEIYRGLSDEKEVSISDLYEKGIATSSLSKVFRFAGLRIGWIKGPKEIIDRINLRRDYHIISTGYINDYLAAIVLKHKDAILKDSKQICNQNREILKQWLKQEPLVDCVVPKAGTVCFLKYHIDMPSATLCKKLQEDTGVFLVPGSCFNREYHLRFGFANDSKSIQKGLALFSKWLDHYRDSN